MNENAKREIATLAGGCFWCLDAAFSELRGVDAVVSGFSGGDPKRTSYRDVCSGATGHAEVVQVAFDSAALSFRDLLHVFFAIHDPTTLNRQGADVGSQYRSAIFFHSGEQERAAREVIAALNSAELWPQPIVTEVVPFTAFFAGEEYHQGYFGRNPDQPYCQAVIAPKIAKFRKIYFERLKREAKA
jgi:peptide-methionine (S)-S-oxide reductase